MKWFWAAIAATILSVAAVGIALAAGSAYGRNYGTGYFSGTAYAGTDWAFEPFGTNPYTNTHGLGPNCDVYCVINLASFETEFQDRLYDPTSVVDQGRAATEIDMMLGANGADFGGSITTGINYARDNFQNWENLMALYDGGKINGYSVGWNAIYNFADETAGWTAVGSTNVNNFTDFSDCTSGQQCAGDLDIMSNNGDTAVEEVVQFNSDGKNMFLRHACGCVTGSLNTLMIPASNITLTGTASPTQTSAGQTMVYNITAAEAAPIPLSAVTVTDTIPSEYQPVAGSCTPQPCTIVANTVTWQYTNPGDSGVLNNITSPGQALSVKVTAVASGSNIVNTATGTATDEFGRPVTVTPTDIITDVLPVNSPIVMATNGDIQAGGGVSDGANCPSPDQNGMVQGNGSGESTGQYIVAASGLNGVVNFGSNDSISGGVRDTLKIGGANPDPGAYVSICREDLFGAAKDYYDAGGPSVQMTGTSFFNVTGKSGIYYWNGPDSLLIFGTVTSKITVVNLTASAPVIIFGNIKTCTGSACSNGTGLYNSASLPSLGIISNGDIDINAAASVVDAFLDADGTINTCTEANSTCDNPLYVDGFLMGHQINLQREGPPNSTGNPVAESVELNPVIYLNPPEFFDTSVDNQLLTGQGEKQPLF
jgi:uncharacterized repeat protein (TIGR01451 family)